MVKNVAEAAASVGKAALLLALPVYVVVDVVRSSVSETYVERRVDLCMPGRDLPASLLGKMDVFLQCATVTEASFGGITLEQAEAVREAAFRSGVETGTEEFQAALLQGAMEDGGFDFQGVVPEPIFIVPDGFEIEEPSPAPMSEEEVGVLRRSLEATQDAANRAALEAFELRAPSLESLGMMEGR